MNEKVILLLIVDSDEDYEEDEETFEPTAIELFKKAKIGKRSISDDETGVYLPRSFKEEFLEVTNGPLNPKFILECNNLTNDTCSCMRLMCFMADECHSKNLDVSENVINQIENTLVPKNITLKFAWLTKCRQTELSGQHLCECKRYLTTVEDISKMEDSIKNYNKEIETNANDPN